MRIVSLTSWREFRDRLCGYFEQDAIRRRQLIFRGQSSADWELLSTLDRWQSFASDADRNHCIARLHDEFLREVCELEIEHVSEFTGDVLELLARHQGLPSAIMDWTQSPYVSAFFAFESASAERHSHVAIWVLDRAIFPDEARYIELIEDFRLLNLNRRARRQQSVFVRVLSANSKLEKLLSPAITKYEIPSSEARIALSELGEMCINATYLFSDMEAAARTAKFRVSLGGHV